MIHPPYSQACLKDIPYPLTAGDAAAAAASCAAAHATVPRNIPMPATTC